jgi:hypothetical protein
VVGWPAVELETRWDSPQQSSKVIPFTEKKWREGQRKDGGLLDSERPSEV